ncbi:unnamed protein product [Rotaria socialis]|uniref:Uncharacterized protein n=1 Tax=Rotaria socialis TaxID=392032 RepID=A0A820UIR3_9BILA|nr:unnamed protein product [Rotaria socialis]CAF4483916.1 unnamed protein product [Rotaria socialis]
MYQHLHMAMEHAERKLQTSKKQNNIRRRRKPTDTVADTVLDDSLAHYDDQMEQESIDQVEAGQQSLTHPDETLHFEYNLKDDFQDDPTDDVKSNFADDFDLKTLEEDSTEVNSTLDLHEEENFNDADDDSILDHLCLPRNNTNTYNLHLYTTTKMHDFCRQLVEIFRDANISNVHCSRLLKLINQVLPQPHNSPTTLKSLYGAMNIEQLFTKRLVCTQCQNILSGDEKTCSNCDPSNIRSIATIFDVNQRLVFTQTLNRLLNDIETYRQQIITDRASPHNNNGIVINHIYQKLENKYGSTPFISLLLHLDGTSLTKSSKLTLWLLSGSIVELPVHLRYRRFNMMILSVWIGYCEPDIDLWLTECLQQLNILKTQGITTQTGINYTVLIYGLTGDCPAIKLATKHVNHQGYWCCWMCFIKGIHTKTKRQYYFEKNLVLRSIAEYETYSKEAQRKKKKIFGHLGCSPFATIVDVPLPQCIVIDYMHVSLLRHMRTVIQYLYQKYLKPKDRDEIDQLFHKQRFPHFFNRKMRPIKEMSYCKATELRNMLLYGLLPLIRLLLPDSVAAHLSLYVACMRLFHGPRKLGLKTEKVANELFNVYYEDHPLFYKSIQHFTLHLHSHFADQYFLHGSLSNLGVFGQESLLGYFVKNKHGARNFGQIITNNYNIDFTINHRLQTHLTDHSSNINELFDLSNISIDEFLRKSHNDLSMLPRRQVLPRQVFTPTQHTPPASHYLIVFENTNSYQIAARSSLKKINGADVLLMVRNKLVKAKLIHSGSLEDCNIEYTRLTRMLQSETDTQNHDGDDEIDEVSVVNSNKKYVIRPRDDPSNFLTSAAPTSPISINNSSPEKISDEKVNSDDELESFFDHRKRRRKQKQYKLCKKKKAIENEILKNHLTPDSDDDVDQVDLNRGRCVTNETESSIHTNSNILKGINNKFNELTQQLTLNSSKFDQQMNHLNTKIDRMTSTTNINRFAIEPYVDKTGEKFPDKLMHDSTDLLGVLGTDYGDYARNILLILYTKEELRTSILPPGRTHLSRKPLDKVRFKKFTDAMRYKFKLSSVNFGQFYRTLLRRKLTDFLIEERRRDELKLARQSLKSQAKDTSQSDIDEIFN